MLTPLSNAGTSIFQRYINQQNNQYTCCLDQPAIQASIFVVIPCYNEPDVLATINSLANCFPPNEIVTLLFVVNDAADDPTEAIAQNILTLKLIEKWQFQHPDCFFKIQRIYAHALPQKWAGVGWARKLGMDEVIRQIVKSELPDGIIISLDADSTVSPNFLQSISEAFRENPRSNFFTIHFEHPYKNTEISPPVREGIIRYELHMRYFRNALQWCGYPHAIYTVGSSFTVKASSYVKQGGMNRRKAGEDFYFLQKLVLLEHYGNISATTVFPASRISDRVPFGTGAALKKWTNGSSELYTTYSLEAFYHLKPLFAHASQFWSMDLSEIATFFGSLNQTLQSYCENLQTVPHLLELRENCSTAQIFGKRIFHLFNAFWILKYLNFAHETTLSRAELVHESVKLLQNLGIQFDNKLPIEDIIEIYRNMDKGINKFIDPVFSELNKISQDLISE